MVVPAPAGGAGEAGAVPTCKIGTGPPVVDTVLAAVPAEPVVKVEAAPLIYFKSTNGSEDI